MSPHARDARGATRTTAVRMRPCARKAVHGLTLVELLVVVIIVGILAGIAYPSYRRQVVRSTRTDAKVSLQQAAQSLEDCFTRFHAYDDPGCTARENLEDGIASPDGHYRITLDEADALTFMLAATPQGGQADDTECAGFTLTEANVRDVTGTKKSTPAGIAECWR